MGRLESILRERFPVSQTARHRVLLRPSPPGRVVVARAKLDETRTTLEVPSCILPRISNPCDFIEDVTAGVVIIGIDLMLLPIKPRMVHSSSNTLWSFRTMKI